MVSPYQATVEPAWIDYNGHLNVAYYLLLFDRALDEMLASFGLGPAYRQQHGCSVFVGEHHVVYDREVLAQARIAIGSRVIDVDDRRLVAFQAMRAGNGGGSEARSAEGKDDRPVATCETLCVHVNLTSRRSMPWPSAIREQLERSRTERADWPARAGRSIGFRRSG